MPFKRRIIHYEELKVHQGGFNYLLLCISEGITQKQMDAMKFCLSDVIPAGMLEKMTEPHHIFDHLTKRCLIQETDLAYLIHLLNNIRRKDLADKAIAFLCHKSEITHKCIVLGRAGSGRAMLSKRLKVLNNTHSIPSNGDVGQVIAADCVDLTVFVADKELKLKIWNTAGMEANSNILPQQFYRGARVALIVFDITCTESFNNTAHFKQQVDDHCDDNVIIFLIGNKADLAAQRQIDTRQGEERARQYGATYLEISAKTGQNTDVILLQVGRALLSRDTQDRDGLQSTCSPGNNNESLTPLKSERRSVSTANQDCFRKSWKFGFAIGFVTGLFSGFFISPDGLLQSGVDLFFTKRSLKNEYLAE